MIHPHLISAILNEPWAISEEVVMGLSPIIYNIFNPNIAFERGEMVLPSMHAIMAASKKQGSVSASNTGDVKNIQVITISGPVMKQDQYCGPAGMKTMGQWIQSADRDSNVDGILLVLDTPGGTVSGTEELASIIKGTQKPIVAFIEDLAASAGYWIACNCDEIIANNTTAQVGSIGVLTSFTDVQPALEKMGFVFHVVKAPQSTHKTEMYDNLRAGDYKEFQDTVLAPLADKFIETVKLNRSGSTGDQHTGKVFFAKDVLGSLVDSIATFDEALTRVAELASITPTAISNPPTNIMNTPKLERLSKAASVDAFESADGTIALTVDQATAVEAVFEAAETNAGTLQSQIDALTDQQTRITELEGELQTANDTIAELSKGAGAASASVHAESEIDDDEPKGQLGFMGRLNSMRKLNNPK